MMKYTWILGGLMAMAITACTGDELMQNPELVKQMGEKSKECAPMDAADIVCNNLDF